MLACEDCDPRLNFQHSLKFFLLVFTHIFYFSFCDTYQGFFLHLLSLFFCVQFASITQNSYFILLPLEILRKVSKWPLFSVSIHFYPLFVGTQLSGQNWCSSSRWRQEKNITGLRKMLMLVWHFLFLKPKC